MSPAQPKCKAFNVGKKATYQLHFDNFIIGPEFSHFPHTAMWIWTKQTENEGEMTATERSDCKRWREGEGLLVCWRRWNSNTQREQRARGTQTQKVKVKSAHVVRQRKCGGKFQFWKLSRRKHSSAQMSCTDRKSVIASTDSHWWPAAGRLTLGRTAKRKHCENQRNHQVNDKNSHKFIDKLVLGGRHDDLLCCA